MQLYLIIVTTEAAFCRGVLLSTLTKIMMTATLQLGGFQPFEDNKHVHPKAHIQKHSGV